MSMRKSMLIASLVVLSLAACGGDSTPSSDEPDSSAGEAASTEADVSLAGTLPMCEEVGYPTAPEDWYSDSPVYVGNEMPIEEARAFASALAGYETIWIDREHNGWVTVGFVDADVIAHQTLLDDEFPDAGVVAVEMPYTYTELDRIRARIHDALPPDMDALNMFEARGVVNVWVGLLTPERIAIAEGAVGDDPACLEGMDPATTPEPGPQPASGDGWAYLAVVDSMVGDRPTVVANTESLKELWDDLGGDGSPPSAEFGTHIVVGFSVLYSGSCPETRFDDVVIEGDLVYPVISHLHTEQECTADGNPRTYLITIQRDKLPEPPFRISYQKGTVLEVQVAADLRQPGSVPADGETEGVTATLPRTATPTPFVIETGFPLPITLDVTCGVEYLGVINGVGWHTTEDIGFPVEWKEATIEGLLDLDILIEEGPEPSLTATAAGRDVRYQPGPDKGDPCD